jgi:hypothetical protein
MEWQSEEFGSSHKGMEGVLLEDGTEPKPAVVLASSSGGAVHRTSELWAYNGKEGNPRAAYVRGSCSCGWRGTNRYPVQWDIDAVYPEPYVEESGAREDWDRHIEEVESKTVPLPADVEDLLERLEERLSALGADSPLAALRAVGAVERIAKRIGWRVACDVDPGEASWDEMGRVIGVSGSDLRRRLMSYRPENSQSWYWAESGLPI